MANHPLLRFLLLALIVLATGHAARAAEDIPTPGATKGAQYKRADAKFYAHGDILRADPAAVILPPTAFAQNGEIYTYTPKKKAPKVIYAEVPNDWIEPITPPDMSSLNIAPDAMQIREPRGDVQVAMPNAPTTFAPAADGQPLPNGAVIKTGDNSTAAILFGGVASARLMPNSEAAVQQAVASTSRAEEVDLTVGGVFSKIGTQPGVQSDFQVHTPYGTALAAGGDFVTLLTNNRIDLWISAGTVDLLQPDGKKAGAVTGDGKGPLKLLRFPAANGDAISADATSLSTVLGFIPAANQKLAALHQKAAANVPLTTNEQAYLARIKQVPALIKLDLIKPPAAQLTVLADGTVGLDGTPLSLAELTGKLKDYVANSYDGAVVVTAGTGATFANYQAAMKAIKDAGVPHVTTEGAVPTAPPPPPAAQDVVVIANGMVKLNGVSMKRDDFTTKLKALVATAPDVEVTIHADSKASFSDISSTIDTCKGAPVKNLTIDLPKLTDLSVAAHQDGTIGFHGATLKLDEFTADLKSAVALYPDLPITLHSNPAMNYHLFKDVADACNAAGAKTVNVIQPAPQPPAPPTLKAFVQADGSVKFQDATLKLDEFSSKIKDAVAATPDAPVTLHADAKAKLTDLSAALNAIKAANPKNFTPTLPAAKELTVTVHGDSSILFHGATISADDFPSEIKAAAALYPDAPVTIHSNPKADYTKFQAVVDACKAASTKEVTIVQPAPEPPKPAVAATPESPAVPPPASAQPHGKHIGLSVDVADDGTITFEQETMDLPTFKERAAAYIKANPGMSLFVDSSPKVPHEKLEAIMDAARAAHPKVVGTGPLPSINTVAPSEQPAAAPASAEPLTVIAHQDGSIKFQGKTMAIEEFTLKIKEAVAAHPDLAVVIHSNPKMDFAKFQSVVDACKNAPAKEVDVVPPAPQPPAVPAAPVATGTATPAAPAKPVEPATALVHDDGSVGFLGKRGTLEEFKTKLAAMVAATPDRQLIIKAAGKNVPYEHVKAVLDACADAHVAHVTVTVPPPATPATPAVAATPETNAAPAAPVPPAPAPVNDKAVPAQIDLAADGSLKLDGTAISEDDLKVKLADIKSTNPKNPLVMIKAPGVSKEQWMHYVDLAHSMNLKLLVKNGKAPAITPMAATPPALRPSAAEGGPAIQPPPAPETAPPTPAPAFHTGIAPTPETPSTNEPAAISQTDEAVPVEIELTPDGLIAFLGETVSDNELQRRLTNVARANLKEPVLIVKDEKVTHEQLQHVVDMCRAAKLKYKVKVVKSSDTGALQPHATLPVALQQMPATNGGGEKILPIEIGLGSKGRITFEGRSVSLDELKARLATIAKGNPNQPVEIVKQADVTDGSVDALVTVCEGVSSQLKISVKTAQTFLPMNAPAANLRATNGETASSL